MIIKQNGWFVSLSKLVGLLLIVGISICYVITFIIVILQSIINNSDWTLSIVCIMWYLFFFGGLFIQGAFLIKLFPEIRVQEDGLLSTSLFFHDKFLWREIIGSVDIGKRSRVKALLIKRKGLLINRLYGSWIAKKGDQPVILVLCDSQNVNYLYNILKEKCGLNMV